MRGLVFPLGVTLSDYESYDGDGGSLSVPLKIIGGLVTGEFLCTKFTGDINIFSISRISAGSWIDLMFVESSGMG